MSDRPNILVLMTDQQRFDTIAAAGFPWMKTPHLDRLVKEGCLFARAHTPNPVCVPARHCHITGTTECNHGITNNGMADARMDGLPTMPRVLSDAGYFTAAVGKMHFTPPNRHHGFDEMHLMEEIPKHRREDAYAEWLAAEGYQDLRLLHGARPLVYHVPQDAAMDSAHHGTKFVALKTIETIDRNHGRQPFFLFSSWVKRHPPWNIPAEWDGLYADADLPEPIAVPRDEPLPTETSPWYGDDDPALVRKAREAYCTSISMIDEGIGMILNHLDDLGITDNTLIIFTSDHGEMLGDHGLFQKMLPYDQASRIPFIVRYPKAFEAGSRSDAFVDLLDIMPTVLEAAGIRPEQIKSARPWDPAGSSLLSPGVGGGRDRSVQRVAYASGPHRWIMLRDDRYKYVYWLERGIEHFFDMKTDPNETRNLVGTDDLPTEVFARLKARCLELELRWGDGQSVVDGTFVVHDTTAYADGLSNCLFPWWSNRQHPAFGEGTRDGEALRFAHQLKDVLESRGGMEALKAAAPDQAWFDHFHQELLQDGVSESTLAEVKRVLELEDS